MQLARPRNAGILPRGARPARPPAPARHRAQRSRQGAELARDADGLPALVDFQLALVAPRRGRAFRALAREDIRHLLKHKRSYCPERLTARERRILATPAACLAPLDGDRSSPPTPSSRAACSAGPTAKAPATGGSRSRAAAFAIVSRWPSRTNTTSTRRLPVAKPFGIRVRLRARDPFTRLVGADWQKTALVRDGARARRRVRGHGCAPRLLAPRRRAVGHLRKGRRERAADPRQRIRPSSR